jgi:hypothetical protein
MSKYKREHLNQNLIAKQGVSEENQDRLCELYDELEDLIELGNINPNIMEVRKVAEDIEQLEFELQRLWGFTESQMHHRYWDVLDKCLCKRHRMDNAERWGHSRIISMDCPLHGSK